MGQREDILGSDDLAVEELVVPEWGQTVRIRRMRIDEALNSELLRSGDAVDAAVHSVIASVVDESGARIFTSEDAAALKAKSAAAIARISKAAMRLNGFQSEQAEKN